MTSLPHIIVLPWIAGSPSKDCLTHISDQLKNFPDNQLWGTITDDISLSNQDYHAYVEHDKCNIKLSASDVSVATPPYALEAIHIKIPDFGINAVIQYLDYLYIEFDPSDPSYTLNNIRSLMAKMPADAVDLLYHSYPGESVMSSSSRLVVTMRQMAKISKEIFDLSQRLPAIASLFTLKETQEKTSVKISVMPNIPIIKNGGGYTWTEPDALTLMRDFEIASKLAEIYEQKFLK